MLILFNGAPMTIARWLNLKDFIFFAFLFIFSSMVAFSDTSEDIADSSYYGLTTDLIIYGLVGSSILNRY
jgi:hypothetical protein